jgi:hypothetical protein
LGKIVASYLVKVHLHEGEADGQATAEQLETLTNDDVKAAIVVGVGKELAADVTVSLIERTDTD